MPWIAGIDEAGYGPNLGPFIMTVVACRVRQLPAEGCLWNLLASVVRRGGGKGDKRLLIDDSKVVHNGAKGLAKLERGVLATLGRDWPTNDNALSSMLARLTGPTDLKDEVWYTGTTPVPLATDHKELPALQKSITAVCAEVGIERWMARSVIVCPRRFNAICERAASKSGVLAVGFIELLEWVNQQTAGETRNLFVDKQGGRNTYAAQVQQGLGGAVVRTLEESNEVSTYEAVGKELTVTFEPRADQGHFPVALASMVSKYLREALMTEFNAFWARHVENLKPTAGYPVDAARFLEDIRPAMDRLQIPEEIVWRWK